MWSTMVVSFALLAAARGFSITGPGVEQCVVNSGQLPLSAAVVGCAGAPCALAQQEDATFDVIFQAPQDASTLTTTATAYLALAGIQIPIPFGLTEKSATCDYLLNASCPIRGGDILVYSLSLYIDTFIPVGVVATIEISIQDNNGGSVMCIRVPIVVDKPKTQ